MERREEGGEGAGGEEEEEEGERVGGVGEMEEGVDERDEIAVVRPRMER